jgi:hypothetical protein
MHTSTNGNSRQHGDTAVEGGLDDGSVNHVNGPSEDRPSSRADEVSRNLWGKPGVITPTQPLQSLEGLDTVAKLRAILHSPERHPSHAVDALLGMRA